MTSLRIVPNRPLADIRFRPRMLMDPRCILKATGVLMKAGLFGEEASARNVHVRNVHSISTRVELVKK